MQPRSETKDEETKDVVAAAHAVVAPAPDTLVAAAALGGTRWRTLRDTLGAALGAVLGLVPHVLHHIGLLAGAALVTGVAGNALLFALGLVFSVPLLLRLYRRFRTWRAPAIAITVFAAVFSVSALVIGPALGGGASEPVPPSPVVENDDHVGHHVNQ